jgi:hypothetical protein
MAKSSRRLRVLISWLLVSVGLIVASCFILNCLVDPLWYLRGNIVTGINYPFDERLAKLNRLLPRLGDYDCVIFGTSRATLLPETKVEGHHCFNLAFSDGQASEYLLYAEYLRQRGFAPSLLIAEVKRGEFSGPLVPPDVPDFIRTGAAPPSIVVTYLSLDALHFSIRTLRGDAPHHRYYDPDFGAHLTVRSSKRHYKPAVPIKPQPAPFDVHADRADLYVQLRQKFPMARAIGYIPPESAWRIGAFSLTGELDAYLGAVGTIAAAYDRFLDFSLPSPMTESTAPADTYDGSHYSREVNEHVLAALLADKNDLVLDWRREDSATIAALYRQRVAQFIAKTTQAEASSTR